MARKKAKYFYNPHTLSYERVEKTIKGTLRKTSAFLVVALFLAGIIVTLLYFFYDSPKERMLKRELDMLSLQYNLLGKRMDKAAEMLAQIQEKDDNIYRIIFEADPVSEDARKAGYGGVDWYRNLEGYDHSQLMGSMTKKLDQLSRRIYIQQQSYEEVLMMAKNKASMLAAIPAIQPLNNKNLQWIASGYGYRIHPIYKTTKMHTGIDFTAPKGTDVYVTGNGVVEEQMQSGTGYGNHVIVNHGYGYKTLYAHLDEVIVAPGQKVTRGQVVGRVGNTGASVAPHLHYEVIRNGEKIDPANYFFNELAPEEYEKVVELASRSNQSFD
ncbi:MAG: M23 family metallopeptidase [Bacteroidetes bacterium]|nr:M23 family metallopeptidase [Bacteroidota bacterium]